MPQTQPQFNFDNTYARQLDGLFVPWQGEEVPDPKMLCLNRALAESLGLDANSLDTVAGAMVLSGATNPEGGEPLAMAYAGHQFGGFAPQLGDGRALLIGEILDKNGQRRDIHLKGSGRTPFSRSGDGKAPLGPVLREYLVAEAMHALGIPTTRALAAVTTGEQIRRNGFTPGAVLTRIASSHIRVGTFQFFASQGENEKLTRLADYTIERLYPEIVDAPNPYLELLIRVRDAHATLVAKWMMVGFVHGVMNTDNTTISGETIDFGPCAFMDETDPATVFSSIDWRGRYAYGNQPGIAQWNIARFAECLIDLVDPDDEDAAIEAVTDVVKGWADVYDVAWLDGMRIKLGLHTAEDDDRDLATDLLSVMQTERVDFTGFFRTLADAVRGDDTVVRDLFGQDSDLGNWFERYLARCDRESLTAEDRAKEMDRVNPIYIPRNHKVEEALAAAESGDMVPFNALFAAVTAPYTEVAERAEFAEPAPANTGRVTTFCGT